ncbi:MAG: PAS domain S-box protein [Ignavibacteria bacterium]|nr:MAG: PAS domain S-box protein [Ignavibacteria bacterium]
MNDSPHIPRVDPKKVLREIANVTGDVLFITDQTRTILYVNRSACRKTGYTRGELLGRKIHHLYPRENQARYTSKILQALRKGGRWSGDIELRKKDGTNFWIDAVAVGLFDPNGKAAGMIHLGHDLTEHRLLDRHAWESGNSLSLIVDAMEDALFVSDPAGKILMCNRAHCTALGYNQAEIVGLNPPYPWMNLTDARRLRRAGKLVLKQGALKNFTIEWKRRDGKHMIVSIAISALRDRRGKVSGFIHTVRDVSDVQHIEELKRSNEQIDRLVTDVRRKAGRLHTLESINRLVLNDTSTTRVFRAVTSGVRNLVSHDLAGIYIYDEEQESLIPHTLSKQTPFSRRVARFALPMGEGIIGAAAAAGKMVWVNNAQLDPRSKYPPAMRPEKEHFIAVPLLSRGSLIGVLVVARNRDPEFIEEETEIVRSFAEAATVALDNERLLDELRSRHLGPGAASGRTTPIPGRAAHTARRAAKKRVLSAKVARFGG